MGDCFVDGCWYRKSEIYRLLATHSSNGRWELNIDATVFATINHSRWQEQPGESIIDRYSRKSRHHPIAARP
jgi:hypothetical protein